MRQVYTLVQNKERVQDMMLELGWHWPNTDREECLKNTWSLEAQCARNSSGDLTNTFMNTPNEGNLETIWFDLPSGNWFKKLSNKSTNSLSVDRKSGFESGTCCLLLGPLKTTSVFCHKKRWFYLHQTPTSYMSNQKKGQISDYNNLFQLRNPHKSTIQLDPTDNPMKRFLPQFAAKPLARGIGTIRNHKKLKWSILKFLKTSI